MGAKLGKMWQSTGFSRHGSACRVTARHCNVHPARDLTIVVDECKAGQLHGNLSPRILKLCFVACKCTFFPSLRHFETLIV